jgi:hypothetical protein
MRRTISAALLVLSFLGCGGSDGPSAPAAASIVGTYNLQSVNGVKLPATLIETTAEKIVVTDDEVTLSADLTYSEIGHAQVTASNGAAATLPEGDTGTYTNANGAVVLSSTIGNGSTNATISGSSLTIVAQGATLVYSR